MVEQYTHTCTNIMWNTHTQSARGGRTMWQRYRGVVGMRCRHTALRANKREQSRAHARLNFLVQILHGLRNSTAAGGDMRKTPHPFGSTHVLMHILFTLTPSDAIRSHRLVLHDCLHCVCECVRTVCVFCCWANTHITHMLGKLCGHVCGDDVVCNC